MSSNKYIQILDCAKIAGNLDDIKNRENFKEISQQLGDGIKQSGFVYLINHSVETQLKLANL